ncbi:MAG: hypothetical protein ACRCYE_13875 [Sarcina sp.]
MRVKKIKFKIKHLLIIAIGVFVVIPNIIIGSAAIINKKQMEETNFEGAPIGYYFQGLLNLYVNMPKISPFEDAAYYYMGTNEYNYKQDLIGISSEISMLLPNNFLAENGVEKAIKYHEKGLEKGEDTKYFYKNLAALTSLYYDSGQEKKAFELLEGFKNSQSKYVTSYVNLNEGILFLKQHKYEDAIESFEKIDENCIPLKQKYIGDANVMAGNFEEGMKDYKSVKYNVSSMMQYNYNKTGMRDKFDIDYMYINLPETGFEYYGDDEKIKKQIENMQNILYSNLIPKEYRGSVKGILSLDEIQGAAIVLSKEQLYIQSWGEVLLRDSQTTFLSYVDKAGKFEFNNIPEGKYVIQIYVPKIKSLNNNLIPGLENGYVTVEKGKIVDVSITHKEEEIHVAQGDILSGNKLSVTTSNEDKFNGRLNHVNGDIQFENDKFIYTKNLDEGNYYLDNINNISLVDKEKSYFYNIFEGAQGDFNAEYNKKDKRSPLDDNYYNLINYTFNEQIYDEELSEQKNKELNEKLKISYPDEVWGYMQASNYKKVLDYYEKEYNSENKNSFTLQMLAKLYTTGTDNWGSDKNVRKALEIAEELYELDNLENGYLQVKAYIYKNFSERFY